MFKTPPFFGDDPLLQIIDFIATTTKTIDRTNVVCSQLKGDRPS